ncbi:MAG: tetratricopeptide repeat protein [Saprospiraceae bacterium]
MKIKFLFPLLLACAVLCAQEKGASPLSPAHPLTRSSAVTRAVVVGISDYQDPLIPDLRFADRDAEAFANFLRSPAGGALDSDHLKVLTNQNATAGRVAEALDGLVEQTKEGDQVIIYFSGHGDVERKTISQPGFLLCWDSPSRVYMGGGTYSLAFLQEIVSTLSVQNKAKVVVVTDACHAGKLAGSQIGGAAMTAANLAKQYANEVKILSCQPDEFSLEGEQWGGGRGCFSYHLVDGLFGLADRNGDSTVTVGEIDRYLEDRVTTEANPQSQVPMLLGNKTERLATVSAAILAELKKAKARRMPVFTATEGRGLEEEILAKLDSGIVQKYVAFKKAVTDKRFFSDASKVGEVQNLADHEPAADELYASLSTESGLAPLHGFMKRNYAAALQDDAQQTLNAGLKTGPDASSFRGRMPILIFTEKVRYYPRCLDRAAELLGEKHYMYAALKARKYFFEGYLMAAANQNPSTEHGKQVLALLRQSLHWQPEQPHVFWQMSRVFGWNLLQPDSVEHYAWKALEAHPNWIPPCTHAAYLLSLKFNRQDRAKVFLQRAVGIDSSSAEIWHSWAILDLSQNNYADAEVHFKKSIALDSTDAIAWTNLGYLYNRTRRYAEAEPALKQAVVLDSTYAVSWNNLGQMYNRTRRYAEAEHALKQAVALDSALVAAWSNLGSCYNATQRYPEAELVFKKALALDSTQFAVWHNIGGMYEQTHRYAEAGSAFKKALALDSTNAAVWNYLGYIYLQTLRYDEAEPIFKKTIALDSTFANPRRHLGMVCFKTKRPNEARQNFQKALALNPNYAPAILGMAYLLAAEGKTTEALGYVEQTIGKGAAFQQLETDTDLAPLRALPEWRELMKKHFPDKVKD